MTEDFLRFELLLFLLYGAWGNRVIWDRIAESIYRIYYMRANNILVDYRFMGDFIY